MDKKEDYLKILYVITCNTVLVHKSTLISIEHVKKCDWPKPLWPCWVAPDLINLKYSLNMWLNWMWCHGLEWIKDKT